MRWDCIALAAVQAFGWISVWFWVRRERRRLRDTVSLVAASLEEIRQAHARLVTASDSLPGSLSPTRRAPGKSEPLPAPSGAVRTPRNEIELRVRVQQYLRS